MSPERLIVTVSGIVARRNGEPYVVLHVNGKSVAQLSIAQAHKIAGDIVQAAARTEADAMIHKFFAKENFPEEASNALMLEFREFRLELDSETVEGTVSNPETGAPYEPR